MGTCPLLKFDMRHRALVIGGGKFQGGSSDLNLPGCVSIKVMDMGLFLAPSGGSE